MKTVRWLAGAVGSAATGSFAGALLGWAQGYLAASWLLPAAICWTSCMTACFAAAWLTRPRVTLEQSPPEEGSHG